jgi:fructokinase
VELKILGIGELLWDVFPDRRHAGGAPFNFAWHARMLGADGQVVTRVGADELGEELRALVSGAGMDGSLVQVDAERPTGTVQVTLSGGQPSYEIVSGVAWDHIEACGAARAAAGEADVVCFGSLAQRGEVSAAAVAELVAEAKRATIIFDVNLRQDYYSRAVLERSLRAADVVKLNDEELVTVGDLLLPGTGTAAALVAEYGLEMLVETRGSAGCALHTAGGCFESPGVEVEVADCVGAGDAFTAALAVGIKRGEPPAAVARRANLVGAFVASRAGATPRYSAAELDEFAASVAD